MGSFNRHRTHRPHHARPPTATGITTPPLFSLRRQTIIFHVYNTPLSFLCFVGQTHMQKGYPGHHPRSLLHRR